MSLSIKIILLFIVLIIAFALTLPTILNFLGLHPKFEVRNFELAGKRALIIATNHGILNKPGETKGKPTGVFLSELSVPYYDFKNSSIEYVGFEPSENVALKAKKNNIKTINDFFNSQSIKILKNYVNNTDIITGSNVICHIPDLKNLILYIYMKLN